MKASSSVQGTARCKSQRQIDSVFCLFTFLPRDEEIDPVAAGELILSELRCKTGSSQAQ